MQILDKVPLFFPILGPPILFFKTKAEEIWEHSKEWNEERACSGEPIYIDI
jgi:hypothetical protein